MFVSILRPETPHHPSQRRRHVGCGHEKVRALPHPAPDGADVRVGITYVFDDVDHDDHVEGHARKRIVGHGADVESGLRQATPCPFDGCGIDIDSEYPRPSAGSRGQHRSGGTAHLEYHASSGHRAKIEKPIEGELLHPLENRGVFVAPRSQIGRAVDHGQPLVAGLRPHELGGARETAKQRRWAGPEAPCLVHRRPRAPGTPPQSDRAEPRRQRAPRRVVPCYHSSANHGSA